ncbi:MAG: type III-A CRISPR-associated RAMP protein Csm5, partial [Chloroflexota bacterium]|nr:type III-A CRISPR-associated RAMP protein Csm5 [Chloroflexota bacterium]
MPDITQQLDFEITVLSPLHIGSGRELLQGYDVVAHGGRTWRIHEDALLDATLGGGEAFDHALVGRPASELLKPEDYQRHPEFFRYVIEGTPSAGTRGARVSEQIKDVFDRPYVPGSSLKGALRTVLFWGIHHAEGRQPQLDRLKRSRSRASQPLEQAVFGRDPNHDWLRALHVRDSKPLDPDEHLALHTVRVYPTASSQSSGLDVDVEAVKPDAVFQTTVSLETYGFEDPEAARLGWRGKRRWIRDLTEVSKRHVGERLMTEARYFKEKSGPRRAMRFYDDLIKQLLELPDDTLFLQVGWGAGWESKTLGSSMLRQSDHAFEQLLNKYRMTKERNRRPGDPFPRSRHLALVDGRRALPMGWLAVRIAGLDEVEVAEPPEPDEAVVGQRTGRLKKFFPDRGFGFIEPQGGG